MKINILRYFDYKKSKIIFYIITFLFGFSIVSISLSTLFQFFFIFIFFVDILIYNYFLKKDEKIEENKNKIKNKFTILFNKIEFFVILLFFLSFIFSFIFSTNYKLSFYRTPVYLSIFFLLFSSFYIFSKYFKDFINLEKKHYLYAILIIFIFYLINFIYLIITYKSFGGIFSDRRSGFLRNAVGYAYCTIIPIFFMIFNIYLFFKNRDEILLNKNTKENFKKKVNQSKLKYIFYYVLFIILFISTLFFSFVSFLSSGTRSAIGAFFISILLFLLLVFIIISKNKILKIFSIFVLILLFIFSALIVEPLIEREGGFLSKKVNIIRSFIINKFFKDKWIFIRLINSGYEIKQMLSWVNHPEITSREDLKYFESAERAALYSASLTIIKKRFLTGTGPFAWYYYVNNDKDINIYFYNNFVHHSHCHNDFLQIFSEFGFFSFIFFLIIILLSFVKIIRNLIKDRENRFLYILFFSILIFFLIGGLTDYLFGHPLVGPFYAFFLGLFLKKN